MMSDMALISNALAWTPETYYTHIAYKETFQ